MKMWWLLGHLIWLSAEDIRERQLSMVLVAELGMGGLVYSLFACNAVAWIPGMLLLGIGCVSGEKVGYGDGWLVLALGMWMSYSELLHLLGLGFLFCIIYAAFAKEKEVPFVPFLTAAYLTGGWK